MKIIISPTLKFQKKKKYFSFLLIMLPGLWWGGGGRDKNLIILESRPWRLQSPGGCLQGLSLGTRRFGLQGWTHTPGGLTHGVNIYRGHTYKVYILQGLGLLSKNILGD